MSEIKLDERLKDCEESRAEWREMAIQYEEALIAIWSLDPGLWKTGQQIAAKALDFKER